MYHQSLRRRADAPHPSRMILPVHRGRPVFAAHSHALGWAGLGRTKGLPVQCWNRDGGAAKRPTCLGPSAQEQARGLRSPDLTSRAFLHIGPSPFLPPSIHPSLLSSLLSSRTIAPSLSHPPFLRHPPILFSLSLSLSLSFFSFSLYLSFSLSLSLSLFLSLSFSLSGSLSQSLSLSLYLSISVLQILRRAEDNCAINETVSLPRLSDP